MKLQWIKEARRDLDEIAAYIAKDKPDSALRWIAVLQQRARRAEQYPFWGRVVPEIGREDVREIIEGSYRIIYRILEQLDIVEVVMVMESHRLLPDIDNLLTPPAPK